MSFPAFLQTYLLQVSHIVRGPHPLRNVLDALLLLLFVRAEIVAVRRGVNRAIHKHVVDALICFQQCAIKQILNLGERD